MRKYGIFILTVYLKLVFSEAKSNKTSSQCETAKLMYKNAGFTGDDIHNVEQTANLKVCYASKTCCKEKAESNLVNISENQRKMLTHPQQAKLYQTFHQDGTKFKAMCRNMIAVSQVDLDKMFEKTYGPFYENNTDVFKKLYIPLNQYLNGSELILTNNVDNFFAEVHQKIYKLAKPLSTFDKKYENCIYENTNYVRPFGDTQRKTGHEISRSFLASRVFLEGLKEGMEVVTSLLNLPTHDECSIAFMKMTQCSICSGISSNVVKPCLSYCKNVMKGCFAYVVMIQAKWDEFINAMVSLAEKLEGSYSLEAAVRPLGVKISEAIMIFQESQGNITEKVEEKCGKLPRMNSFPTNIRKRHSGDAEKSDDQQLNRKRRSVSGSSREDLLKKVSESEDLLSKFKTDTQKIINGITSDSTNSLDFLYKNKEEPSDFEKLIASTRSGLKELRDFWIMVPHKLCESGLSSPDSQNCWNGRNTSGYSHKVVGDSKDDLFSKNPEMKLNKRAPTAIIQQYRKLDAMVKRIKIALIGEEETTNVDNELCSGDRGSGDGEDSESGDGQDGSGNPDCGESGSGEIPTTIAPTPTPTTTQPTTVDKCLNSVDLECSEETDPNNNSENNGYNIDTNDVNLPIVKTANSRGDSGKGSANIGKLDIVLLNICLILTYFLL